MTSRNGPFAGHWRHVRSTVLPGIETATEWPEVRKKKPIYLYGQQSFVLYQPRSREMSQLTTSQFYAAAYSCGVRIYTSQTDTAVTAREVAGSRIRFPLRMQ